MIWHLPGPQRFVEEIGRAIEANQHVVVALPSTVTAQDVCLRVAEWLRRFKYGILTRVDVDTSQTPEANLGLALGTTRYRTLEKLLRYEEAPSRVIALCVGQLDPERSRQWLDFIRRLADASHHVDWAPYQLLLVGGVDWVDTPCDTHLSMCVWWGVCSPLDVDIMLGESLPADFSQRAVHALWIRSLCRGLVPDDPNLVPHVADGMPRTIAEIRSLLAGFGEREGRVAHRAPASTYGELGFLDVRCPPFPKDADSRRAWSVGALNWVPGLGRETHVLSVLSDESEIFRRVWRGQLDVLFPLVERVRQWLLDRLSSRWGCDWSRVLVDDLCVVERDAADFEIGPLARYLSRANRRGVRSLATVARRWRDVRNALAHGDMVQFDLLSSAIESIRSAHRDQN